MSQKDGPSLIETMVSIPSSSFSPVADSSHNNKAREGCSEKDVSKQIFAPFAEIMKTLETASQESLAKDIYKQREDTGSIKAIQETLRIDIEKLATEISEQSDDMGTLKTSVSGLEKDIKSIKASQETLKTDIETAGTNCKTLKTRVSNQSKRIAILEGCLNIFRANLTSRFGRLLIKGAKANPERERSPSKFDNVGNIDGAIKRVKKYRSKVNHKPRRGFRATLIAFLERMTASCCAFPPPFEPKFHRTSSSKR